IDPLPDYHRNGLIAVSTFALLSLVATLGMLLFMTCRLVFWRRFSTAYPGYNQYVILIYNLLIADLIQACAFSLNLYWVSNNKIDSPSAACFMQGLFIQLGDPGSGLFALAIAAHTFMQAVFGRQIEYRWFISGILSIWGFMIIMCIIPIASHLKAPHPVFAPTGAWCWINTGYEKDRLWTHYFWIFVAEFGTLVLYGIMYFELRRRIAASPAHQSQKRLIRIVNMMVMYPIAYVVLSLPLAVGRMSTAQGHTPSVRYFCVAGSMITCSGLCDVVMYTFTRRALAVEPENRTNRSDNLNPFHHQDYRSNHIATVVAMTARKDNDGISIDHHESCESIIGLKDARESTDAIKLSDLYQKTTIEVTSEPAYPSAASE
ncbi:G protein-coupled glucose receptor regulating Gpa2-domain-containing protein, partial [Talaromyces proteolyticus]